MTRRKLQHFAEMKTWENVFEPDRRVEPGLRGTWGEHVILELGCGRGDFSVGLATAKPEVNFVGVDIKGSRLWHGAGTARSLGLKNLSFLRCRIEDLPLYFAPGEVDEIWLTFPDPQLREGSAKKRLSAPRFLAIYSQILKKGGALNLKTDSSVLFDFSVESLQNEGWKLEAEVRDLHGKEEGPKEAKALLTQYERKYLALGKPIFYLSAVSP